MMQVSPKVGAFVLVGAMASAQLLCFAEGTDFTPLTEIVRQAILTSDALHAQKQSESVAEGQLSVVQTDYYPNVNAEALDSTGFPGSTAPTGVTGIMGSPFRSGFSYGLVATEMLFDFGKTSASMDVARKNILFEKSRTEVGAFNVEQAAIDLYYTCARVKTQANWWTQIESDSGKVQKEVEHFVNTGQRSIVDGLLAKQQTEEFSRNKQTYSEQLGLIISRLQVVTGIARNKIICPDLNNSGYTSVALTVDSYPLGNPYIQQAEAEKNSAVAQVEQAKSGYLPKIMAVGSIGDMDDARLVPKNDYAVGFGLIIPLFDGLRTPREVHTANALRIQKEAEVDAAHQFVDDTNLKFEQQIRSNKVAIDHLQSELSDADHAFQVARKRYLTFSGSLVDVRESIRNYSRLHSDYIDIQADWQRAIALKAAFNGKEF